MYRWRVAGGMLGVIGLGSILVPSCGEDESLVLTDRDSGSEIDIGAGDRFEIHLESIPSTGFSWEISAMSTPGIAALESRSYEEPDIDLVGAEGTEVFVFDAGAEGAGVLRLEYLRSFDDPVVAERVAEFVLLIDGAEATPPGGAPPVTRSTATPASDQPDSP